MVLSEAVPDRRAGRRPARPVLVLLGALLLALVVAGCGGRNRPAAPPATPTASGTGAASTPLPPLPATSGSMSPSADATPPAPTPDCRRPTARLTVVSWNVKSGRFGTGGQLDRVAALLQSWDADVVLLQELDRGRHVSGRVDQPAYLAGLLGMEVAFGANVELTGGGQYGTAILSRHPITDAGNTLLPNRPGLEQRGLLRARIEPHGVPIHLYTTHLQHTSEEVRVEQARAVVRTLAADPERTVLGGDLNAGPGTPVLAVLLRALADPWSAVGVGSPRTFPAHAPRARIDYLLHDRLRPLLVEVPEVVASDHRPVRAVYRYRYGRCGR